MFAENVHSVDIHDTFTITQNLACENCLQLRMVCTKEFPSCLTCQIEERACVYRTKDGSAVSMDNPGDWETRATAHRLDVSPMDIPNFTWSRNRLSEGTMRWKGHYDTELSEDGTATFAVTRTADARDSGTPESKPDDVRSGDRITSVPESTSAATSTHAET